MESISLLLGEALSPYQVTLTPSGAHGECLSGWNRRQPMREDQGNVETGAKSAAERKREQRVRDKNAQTAAGSQTVTPSHDGSQQIRLDSDTDNKNSNPLSPPLSQPPPKPKRKTRLPEPFNVCEAMRRLASSCALRNHVRHVATQSALVPPLPNGPRWVLT